MDQHAQDWIEQSDHVVFINILADLNQPYSCQQWGDQGIQGMPVIVHDPNTTYFGWLHDHYNGWPTYALLDHEMRVRAKPWTYDNNTNYDWECYEIDGCVGGDTDDFIQQLVDECEPCNNPDLDGDGVLNLEDNCPDDFNPDQMDSDGDLIGDVCDDCHDMPGDVNDDSDIDILDIVTTVQIILNGGFNSPFHTDCEKSDADYSGDGIINILDVIQIINIIVGVVDRVSDQMAATAEVVLTSLGSDLQVHISSDTPFCGVQMAVLPEVEFNLDDQSHIEMISQRTNGVSRLVAYSSTNQPFMNNTAQFTILNGAAVALDEFEILVGDLNGGAMELNKVVHDETIQSGPYRFELSGAYPNPFNPVTTVSYQLAAEGPLQLIAYNATGQKVDDLFNGYQSRGAHTITWNAAHLPSGVYYIQMISGDRTATVKTVLMK